MPAPIIRLSDGMLQQLLSSPDLVAAVPEFQPAVDAVKLANTPVAGKCAPCTRNKRRISATQTAMQILLALPPDRQAALKSRMGVAAGTLVKTFKRTEKGLAEVVF